MKNTIKYLLILCLPLTFFACEEINALEEVGADLNNGLGNSYVTISGSAETAMEGETVTVTVALPNPISGDVSVDFTFSGNAQFDVDFNGTPSSGNVSVNANGGSGNIEFKITAGGADSFSFDIVTIDDGIADPDETLTIALSAAKAADGTPIDLGIANGGAAYTLTITE